jgi:hypothetical protein
MGVMLCCARLVARLGRNIVLVIRLDVSGCQIIRLFLLLGSSMLCLCCLLLFLVSGAQSSGWCWSCCICRRQLPHSGLAMHSATQKQGMGFGSCVFRAWWCALGRLWLLLLCDFAHLVCVGIVPWCICMLTCTTWHSMPCNDVLPLHHPVASNRFCVT